MELQNKRSRRYSAEQKSDAVRMVRTLRAELGTDNGTISRVAKQLGYGPESVGLWVRQADIDEGVKAGVTTGEQARVKELEQEVRELRRANEILKRAAFFLRGGARPPTQELVVFINRSKDDIVAGRRLGVELICKVLQMAPSTYYAANGRIASAREIRDAELMPRLLAIWEANYSVYGVRKLWKAAKRAGINIGRDQVARLMKTLEIEGACREKRVKTTKRDLQAARHPDLVNRVFSAEAPNQLWVTDLTFVPTWQGIAYVCFIIDVFDRAIVGWRCASNMKTETVLDAIEMARWSRGKKLPELRCHSDAGSQFTSIRYGERLAEIGATPSIGTVGDSYDNALAESVNGYYKAELVRGPAKVGPWKTIDDLELATLGWVHWHNTERLHSYLGDVPPAEFYQAFYDGITSVQELVKT
ncbi:MAG TPA: IS3 family transposase [Microbacteriaceae bacterium]|nr:IS3 family transposase [Microbacteriaceae bacterium]